MRKCYPPAPIGCNQLSHLTNALYNLVKYNYPNGPDMSQSSPGGTVNESLIVNPSGRLM